MKAEPSWLIPRKPTVNLELSFGTLYKFNCNLQLLFVFLGAV